MRAWLSVVLARVRGLFGRQADDADFDAETASHLQMIVDEHVRRGATFDEARRSARLEFGGSMQTIEHHREGRSLPFFDTTLQDVRYALRSLWRYPAFSLVAIATLAFLAGAGGLGQPLYEQPGFKTNIIMVGVLTIAMALLLDLVVVLAQRFLLPWQRARPR